LTITREQTQPGNPSLSSSEAPTLPSVTMLSSHELTTTLSSNTSPTSPTSADRATISKSLQIKGEVICSESLYVEGTVEGAIYSPDRRITVGRGAQVSANIIAGEVVVLGKLRGNIYASDRVDLRSEGSVTGDVVAQRITVGDGAFFDGGIHIGKPGQQKDRDVRAEISSNESRKVPIAVSA
jgi:cytoskeletal protein CcmA (bactofilin family)